MNRPKLTIADYPMAEKRPDLVVGRRGKMLDEITLQAVLDDYVTMEDMRITATALHSQAEIARAAGRPTLAENFERAAELVEVPQDIIMRTYEMLRPGRANSKAELVALAQDLRATYGATAIAAFIDEAAEIYERRGLFTLR
ncbi:MAG: diol dehydratase small subunit [Hyphomicrobiaceae bacterium]